ncbi:MAG: secretin N-terminal domain-containing protein [Verrucomicrobia bacterium]|nr:secretin N-terminal domain-containing protein [Verrucomicrobiota bacterium]
MKKHPLLALNASILCTLASFAYAAENLPQPPAPAAAEQSARAIAADTTSGQPEKSMLDQDVFNYRGEEEDIQNALQLIGRTYNLTVVSDPDIIGKTTFQVPRGTVRDVLNSICQPNGYYYEQSKQNPRYIYVKKNKSVLYTIEYPQLERTSTGNSSVTLSGGNGGSGSGASGFGGYGGGGYGGTHSPTGNGGSSGNNSSMSDQTSIQISSTNEGDFWAGVNEEIKGMLRPGETYFINKFTGIVSVKAAPRRHEEDISPYINLLNDIINQEVFIDAQILEISFSDQNKLGVDWTQAATSIDNAVDVNFASTATNITTVGATQLGNNTFAASVSSGKLSAVISALKEQGTVRSKSNPKLSTLNNQTAIIAVGTEQTFFSLDSSFNQSTATSVAQTSTVKRYVKDKYTFGVVLQATPYVRRDGSITLDLLPSITKLVGFNKDPDQNPSPNVDQKRISTIVRLRPGEAAIIGGMITETDGTQTNSVPFLGRIPGIGQLFRTDATNKSHSEIVIILTASTKKPLANTSALAQVSISAPVAK